MACDWNLNTYTKKVIQIVCALLRLWKLSVWRLARLSPWSSCLRPRWHQICCSCGRCLQHSPFPGLTCDLNWEVGELLFLASAAPSSPKIGQITPGFWLFYAKIWSISHVEAELLCSQGHTSESWRGRRRQLGLCQGGFGVTCLDPIAVVPVWNFSKAATIVSLMILPHGLDKM